MTTTPAYDLRAKWLDALLPHVPFDGWSQDVADKAADSAGLSEGEKALAAPRGVPDLIEHFFDEAETSARAALEKIDFDAMRVPEKVKAGVQAWLAALEPHRDAVRQVGLRAGLPWATVPAASRAWKVADMIWTEAGDTSEDYNKYSKRGLLAVVLPTIVFRWADSPDEVEMDAYISRQLKRASDTGRTAGKVLKPALEFFERLAQKPQN